MSMAEIGTLKIDRAFNVPVAQVLVIRHGGKYVTQYVGSCVIRYRKGETQELEVRPGALLEQVFTAPPKAVLEMSLVPMDLEMPLEKLMAVAVLRDEIGTAQAMADLLINDMQARGTDDPPPTWDELQAQVRALREENRKLKEAAEGAAEQGWGELDL